VWFDFKEIFLFVFGARAKGVIRRLPGTMKPVVLLSAPIRGVELPS